MNRRARMVLMMETRRLAKRTQALGLAWAALLIVKAHPGEWTPRVREMLEIAEKEER